MAKSEDKRKGKNAENDNKSRNSKIFLGNKTPCRRQTLEDRHTRRER